MHAGTPTQTALRLVLVTVRAGCCRWLTRGGFLFVGLKSRSCSPALYRAPVPKAALIRSQAFPSRTLCKDVANFGIARETIYELRDRVREEMRAGLQAVCLCVC